MATYKVRDPQGNIREISGPDGASDAEIIAQAQKLFSKPTMQQIEVNGPTNPTDGMSGLQKFGAGAGKAFMDIGRGVGQLVGAVDQKSVDEAKRLDAPLMQTGAGLAGNIVGNMAAFAPTMAIPGVNTLTGASLAGAAMGGSQPVATGESRLENAGIGAAGGFLGQGIANSIGRLVKPVQSSLNPVEQGLAQKASQMGIPLTVGQKTGSRPLQITESVLENLPFTADKQLAIKEGQRLAFNKAAAKTIGENADLITPDVLNAAKTRIGSKFNEISARNSIKLDGELASTLKRIVAENAEAGPLSSKKVDRVANWITGLTEGTPEKTIASQVLTASGQPFTKTIPAKPPVDMAGDVYQKVRSIVSRSASDAFSSGDSQLGQSLKAIREGLDAAAEKSISAADKSAWDLARQQWQALKVLEKAAAPTTADAVAGNVSPAKLANALNTVDKNFKYGKGQQELGDLARVGKAFIQDNIPNSGTAQRTFYQNVIENPLRLLSGAAGVGSVPIQALLNSKAGQAYLTQGLLPNSPTMGLLGQVGGKALPLGMPSLLYAGQQ